MVNLQVFKSLGLWRWYINITITIPDIIHPTTFYLKFNSTQFCWFVRITQEIYYVSPTSPTWLDSTQLNSIGLSVPHRKH
jgi:hypothetical protein